MIIFNKSGEIYPDDTIFYQPIKFGEIYHTTKYIYNVNYRYYYTMTELIRLGRSRLVEVPSVYF